MFVGMASSLSLAWAEGQEPPHGRRWHSKEAAALPLNYRTQKDGRTAIAGLPYGVSATAREVSPAWPRVQNRADSEAPELIQGRGTRTTCSHQRQVHVAQCGVCAIDADADAASQCEDSPPTERDALCIRVELDAAAVHRLGEDEAFDADVAHERKGAEVGDGSDCGLKCLADVLLGEAGSGPGEHVALARHGRTLAFAGTASDGVEALFGLLLCSGAHFARRLCPARTLLERCLEAAVDFEVWIAADGRGEVEVGS